MTSQSMESALPISSGTTPTVPGGASNGQPTSPAPVTFTPEQVAYLQPFIEQQAQSFKDRRLPALENEQGEIKKMLTQLLERSGQASQGQVVSPANGVTQPAQPAAIDYLAPLKAVGLDANDSEVLALMVKHNGDQMAFNAALVGLKQTRLTQPPAPASAIPAPSGSIGTGGKIDLTNIKDPAKLYEMARETGAKLPGRAG